MRGSPVDSIGQQHEYEGVLDKIVFQDESSGWSVVKFVVLPSMDLITVTGTFFGLREGDRIKIRGAWMNRPPYGRQFRLNSFVPVKPHTIEGIREYLSSGFIKGVGRDTADRLIHTFGLRITEIIEQSPDELTRITGIGRKRARSIHEAWKKHHEMADIMIFLQSLEISATYAYRIFKFYGNNALRLLQENPYRLCYDIQGIGFRTADRIALKYGIPRVSSIRIKAGIVYALGETTEKGHVCTPVEILISKAAVILEVPDLKIRDTLEGLLLEGEITIEVFSGRKFVYLRTLYEAEAVIAEHIRTLSSATGRMSIPDIPEAVKWFEEANGISLAKEQKTALIHAMMEKLLIITGGPGTGKTTLIRGIIEVCERRGIRFELCAPTGRAAKRMAEATGRNAQTIHRLFELTPQDQDDYGIQGRKIKTDMLIIDEASMVDTVLFSRILKGIEDGTSLILVGDADQLPSVGPGNVLKDIIRSGTVKTIRLTTIFRQGQESLIVINAHRINQGLLPQENGKDSDGDFFFIHREKPEEIIDVIKELVAHRIPKRFGFDPIRDIQVLSPMHRGIVGVENLNAELQLLLNPSGRGFTHGAKRFCEGDKVMQLRNNYEQGIFNGDMGTIMAVDTEKKVMDIDFEDRIIRYEGMDLDQISVAYACSIHKSQGNEYPAVVLVLHSQHGIMLERNLLYTAVTRGRALVIVVGNRQAIERATKNVTKSKRYTLLCERLKGLI